MAFAPCQKRIDQKRIFRKRRVAALQKRIDQDFEQIAELQESNARGEIVIAELQTNVNSTLEMVSELEARCADYDMQL